MNICQVYLKYIFIFYFFISSTFAQNSFEGECFCTKSDVINHYCAMRYKTIEYNSDQTKYRNMEFCLNYPQPSSSLKQQHTFLSLSPSSSNIDPHIIPFTDYIGNCQCYSLPIFDPRDCDLLAYFSIDDNNDWTEICIILNPTFLFQIS